MTHILGHNYIGGQRSAAGTVIVYSVDASTGENLPHDFYQATVEEVDAAAKAAASAYPAYRSLSAEKRAQFLMPSLTNWTHWATTSLPPFAARPRCRQRAFKASAAV